MYRTPPICIIPCSIVLSYTNNAQVVQRGETALAHKNERAGGKILQQCHLPPVPHASSLRKPADQLLIALSLSSLSTYISLYLLSLSPSLFIYSLSLSLPPSLWPVRIADSAVQLRGPLNYGLDERCPAEPATATPLSPFNPT